MTTLKNWFRVKKKKKNRFLIDSLPCDWRGRGMGENLLPHALSVSEKTKRLSI